VIIYFVTTEGVGSRFHVLRSQTHFGRYRGRRVPFSCFARPDSFSAVSGATCPFLMFCAPGLIFGGTEGVGSRFHVFRSRTHFRRFRGRRVPFSSFALSVSFSAESRASDSVFRFCAPGIVFGSTEGDGSRFHVFRSRTSFRRCRGHRFSFSCFALPDSFSAVPSASVPVFMFSALELVFDGTEGVGSRFPVFLSLTRFLR
jgi:hypothetical protein